MVYLYFIYKCRGIKRIIFNLYVIGSIRLWVMIRYVWYNLCMFVINFLWIIFSVYSLKVKGKKFYKFLIISIYILERLDEWFIKIWKEMVFRFF